MDKHTQIELLSELLALHQQKTPYLDEQWERADCQRYHCADFFAREQARISRKLPQIVAHSSELPSPGSFQTVELGGYSIFLVRGEDKVARAFHNVCRHRGAQLVQDERGCARRFSCPYHAWTYSNSGELIAVPHEKTGFPGLDRQEFALRGVPCEEYAGWVWICLDQETPIDVAAHLGSLTGDFNAFSEGEHVVFSTTVRDAHANWKLLVEGGLESYHFRVAHKKTIAPLFQDNLSSYRCFGRHMRSILPRSSLHELREQEQDQWNIRQHTNILYSLFPGSQFLVQDDHFIWIQGMPVAPDHTRLRLSTIVPKEACTSDRQSYWRKNHELTMATLNEDFDLAEGIQAGIKSGANPHLNFGRFEGALAEFNRCVDEAIG